MIVNEPIVVMNEIDIVRDLTEKLESIGVSFMITGSLAMNYYAVPRMTRDIDLVVELTESDVDGMYSVFSPDYYVAREAMEEATREKTMFNMIHDESIIKVDCIVRKDSVYRKQEFERRKRIRIQDFETWIVSKEDLVLSKLVWAGDSRSEMQLRDAGNLLKTGCDDKYLWKWAGQLKVDSILRELLHE